MSIKVALHHRTSYRYDRPISVGPQVIRLRPAPHCRTPIESYSLRVEPADHFLNWQQDPHGNFLARIVFEEKIERLSIDVNLVANLSTINPFDFFVEDSVTQFPFQYNEEELEDLKPYLVTSNPGPKLTEFLGSIHTQFERTIDFLVDVNQRLQSEIDYLVRLEPGVQTCEQTLTKRSGSCRDSAWLLVQILRNLGIAARFTSGYLIQLKPDVKSLDGPSGTEVDFTDLHAWTEVFLPGAGWIGLDPTSGLLTGEGHLPLASTPNFSHAAAITGAIEECESEFEFDMSIKRIHEDPRVTKPYTNDQWNRIDRLGMKVDRDLEASDVRLTMGGEPTFVSIDDPDSSQWQTDALGSEKNQLANVLMTRMRKRFGNDTFVHYGQGKWYPGEPLPRWSKTCYARKDGKSIWKNQEFLAAEGEDHQHNDSDARKLVEGIAERLNVDDQNVAAVYEDALYHIWQEQRLPQNVDLNDLESVQNEIDRNRLAQVLQKGLSNPSGYILPLMFDRNLSRPRWRSGHWKTKADRIFLVPGDSPIGYRLPLKSLQSISEQQQKFYQPLSPVVHRDPLPDPETFRLLHQSNLDMTDRRIEAELLANAPLDPSSRSKLHRNRTGQTALLDPLFDIVKDADSHNADLASEPEDDVCPTIDFDQQALPFALCAEVRNGTVHVFLPPTDQLEQYLEILSAIEESATQFELPVIIEGYQPPRDHRLKSFSITPDPGVIEVNVAPSATWEELKETTAGLYEDAYHSRLGTEKFDVDGAHTGTGGGNHVVLGGPSPLESPLLRRPDLLKSLLGFWQNHPSLSYLFSSRFVGSTSQAPRVDEGRVDALYELQIAFDELDRQIQRDEGCPPWMADRIFRNLLIDVTGNTHRAEFCIDKLYSPDSATGKLGLLEFRGFEMPPHHQMSLTQQLLIRTLVAKFWNEPYRQPLVDWGTRLHDQFMLPTFVWRDFCDVAEMCQQSGYEVEADWFQSHFEFRFPFIGGFTHNSVDVEIRQAIEPWNVLGEESTASGTSRYVDSSIERMELKVSGFVDERYLIVCNGIEVPLHPTEQAGQYVAGIRFRAWQPPSCLHPTIPVDGPLVFDLYDRWLGRSVDGCQYFVGHPGGLNPTIRPVNSLEAESRRAARFSKIGHSGTKGNPRKARPNNDFPMTLDLRREKN